ncbi:MAG: DUF1254 domain-containing protein, partial [Gammaproteobacteria bacterium]|nr:DUF1254 domain-containing protein [Gammaproteobacteria bacterium]
MNFLKFNYRLIGAFFIGALTLAGCSQEPIVKTNQAIELTVEEKRFERRVMEAGIWVMPQVMYERMAQVAFDTFGGEGNRNNTVYFYERPMTAEAAMVTGNNNSPYVHTYHNIEDGPIVVVIPAATD